jgi:hypothetical protein
MTDAHFRTRSGGLVCLVAILIATIGCDLPPDPTLAGAGLKSVPESTAAGPPPPPSPPSPSSALDAPSPAALSPPTVDSNRGAPESSPASVPSEPAQQPPPPVDVAQQNTSPTPASGSLPAKPTVQLSAGVAVPQSLPGGTQIGVSVDYRVSGTLHPSARYALVVESGAGELALEVRLAAEGGTLQSFLPLAVRPEHQPFRARVEMLLPGESQPTKISNTANLQTNY